MNIIITGAGKGIGFETALQLSKNPEHKIVAISRTIDSLRGLSKNIIPIAFDLSELPNNQFIEDITKPLDHRVDVLINNAGLLITCDYDKYTLEDFNAMMNVNLRVPHLLIQSLLPYFTKPSHVVNISSMGGFSGSAKFTGLALYSTFKGALCTLSECLAEELKPRQISVNALCLGAVQTEMLSKAFPNYMAPTTAPQMAQFIADFAINGNKYFNGKIIPVANTTP
jgi:NAD(P)-dependent dehydrogenase (short-subunit alcohol dehydrogenase family)